MTDDVLQIEPLTADRWRDVVALFGTRGDPSWCWCQFFLTTGKDYTESAAANRRAFRAQVTSGDRAPGLLAYAAGTPVGWVQLGPRTAYPRLCESRALAAVTGDDLPDPTVWAVTCFVVKVGHRRKGVGRQLLAAAVEFARDAGARVLEGHPVDVAARASGKVSGAELYHGVASTFLAAGFTEVGRTGPTRPVMRLNLVS
jgi:GNAT superfamily N-acetyltransferase